MPELIKTILANNANLKAYYRFESGALTTDSSGQAHTLTNNNTVAETTGKFGGGASTGTGNTNKNFSTTDTLDINGGAISMSIWVKMNAEIASGVQSFLFQGNNTAQVGYEIDYEYNGGTRRLGFIRTQYGVGSSTAYATTTLGTTDWHHIVLTNDGTTTRGYLNGRFATSVAASGNGAGTFFNGFTIFSQSTNNYASASMDDVAVFNVALSADQIKELYEGRFLGELRPNQFGTTAGLWHLSNETDYSGNNYHLTNNNSVGFVAGKFGNCADFGTANTNKSLTIASNLGIVAGNITMAGWFKMRTEIGSGVQELLHHSARSAGANTDLDNRIYYDYNGGTRRLVFRRYTNAAADANYTVTLGTSNWHHLAYVFNGSTVVGYLNGAQVASVSATSTTYNNSTGNGFRIGMYEGGFNYASILADELTISSTALTANQIRTMYVLGVGKYY